MFWDVENLADRKTGLYDGGPKVFLSYGCLLEKINRLQSVLQFSRKTLIALFCDNSASSVVAYLAALRSGHAVLLVNASTDTTLQRRLLDIYQPEIILSMSALVDLPVGYTFSSTPMEGLFIASQLNSPGVEIHPETAVLLSTSGTTGSPKLIRLSYGKIQSNAESISASLGITSAERAITSLPMSYAYGLSVINSHLLQGAGLVCTNESLASPGFWSLFNERQCTSLAGVPFTYQMLERLRLEKLNPISLRTLTQAGGRLAPEKVRYFAKIAQQRNIRFIVMYGQTEATARISYVPWERLPDKIGSVGIAIPGGKIHIRHEGINVTKSGVEGEVVYEGPNVMQGYAETRQCLAKGDEMNGILSTGDLGYLDDEGYLFITGRLKRFIKLAGLRLNLDEVEKMLEGQLALSVASLGHDDRLHLVVESEFTDVAAESIRRVSGLYKIHPSMIRGHTMAALSVTTSGKKDYAKIQRDIASF
jgi:acyl-CoA synthetase (AMP-forming)/AMP-acid ligase II